MRKQLTVAVWLCMRTNTYTRIHAQHARTQKTHTHACTHTHAYTRVHARARTHTYFSVYKHTHARSLARSLARVRAHTPLPSRTREQVGGSRGVRQG